ncbi:helix-turn-helix domain-containing protein [Planctomycetaceae bacterium SH139]
MPAPPSLFSPKQVADALQVSESSVKRWCDQGLIPMIRTAGGHRRIPLDELIRFLGESERPLLNPMAIGLEAPPVRMRQPRTTPGTDEQKAFRQALAMGNHAQCSALLRAVWQATGSATAACELLITDAMHRFGEAWERNELEVYQERRGCEICTRLILELRSAMGEPTGPIAIGGSPEGDNYQLPTSLVDLALREVGWRAESLGTNLPFATLMRAIEAYRPQMVWLSVSIVSGQEMFVKCFNELADTLPDDCVLMVGGRGLTDAIRPLLRYTAHCDSLNQLVGLAEVIRRQSQQLPAARLPLQQSDN